MNKVAIVDYGAGNLDSVRRAIEECGGDPWITDRPQELRSADRIVLPGVGAFNRGMEKLRELQFDTALAEEVFDRDAPLLGVCLGMQLLATTGAEGGESKGLGWIEGHVRRLEPAEGRERVPHMGWNEVRPLGQPALFEGVNDASDFYFVHSYHLDTHECQAAVTDYCGGFVSAVERGHVFGVQFHPEKSQRAGLRVLKNFLAI